VVCAVQCAVAGMCPRPRWPTCRAVLRSAVADLFGLDTDSHLLERHYNATLIGSLPDARQKYMERYGQACGCCQLRPVDGTCPGPGAGRLCTW
jgi:hypothetical protein